MINISATRYNTFKECELKYLYKYEYHLLELKGDALIIGSFYHELLEKYHSNTPNDELLKEIKKDKNADMIIGLYNKYLEAPIAGNVIETEHEFSLDIPGLDIPIYGFIDRVDEDKGIEYKTSSKDYKEIDTRNIQADIYLYVLLKKFGRPMPLLYVVNNKKKINSKKYEIQSIEVTKTEKEILEVEDKIKEFVVNEKHSSYPASPGIHCYWCSFGKKMGDGTCPYSK